MKVDYWTNLSPSDGFYTTWKIGERGYVQQHTHQHPSWHDITTTPAEHLCQSLYGPTRGPWSSAVANLPPGEFFPRIQREVPEWIIDGSQVCPPMRTLYASQYVAARASARNLFAQLEEVFRYVEPATANRQTYGDQLRSLLILACTEVESALKAIVIANGGATSSARLGTTQYIELLGPMRLDEYEVRLNSYPDYGAVAPFRGWHKQVNPSAQPPQDGPTKSLQWYQAYNKAKHNREEHLSEATLEHAISAMCAVHIMIAAQFGDEHPLLQVGTALEPYSRAFRISSCPRWALAEIYVPPNVRGPSAPWKPTDLFANPLVKPKPP